MFKKDHSSSYSVLTGCKVLVEVNESIGMRDTDVDIRAESLLTCLFPEKQKQEYIQICHDTVSKNRHLDNSLTCR